MGQLGSMDLEMENEHAASAPAYIDPRGGQTCSLSEPRWRSDEGLPLMITPLPGIGRGDIHSGTRSLWRKQAGLDHRRLAIIHPQAYSARSASISA